MVRRLILLACLVLALRSTAPSPAQAAEPGIFDSALDSYISMLMDPHANSRDKLHACRALAEMGPAARPAALALARQSHYDMEPVREQATATLLRLVGPEEAARLRQQVLAMDLGVERDATDGFLKSAKTWDDFPKVAEFLKVAAPSVKATAARAAVRIWDAAPALPKDANRIFVDDSKVELLEALSLSYADLSTKERRSA